jgi:hypothetical protein
MASRASMWPAGQSSHPPPLSSLRSFLVNRRSEVSTKSQAEPTQTLASQPSDEDITNTDTPTVVAYDSKVKLFFSISIFNTCDEWTLYHDMCSVSFIEVLTWIKEGVDHAWKG